MVEEKKEEYQEYANGMKDLVQRYSPPDRDLLQQAYEKRNITSLQMPALAMNFS